jgi:hypothetical protein
MRFKEIFKDALFAVLFVSVLGLVIMEARCVIDEDEELHGDPPLWWWTNYAYVAGERDGIYPNKYFWEWHYARDTVWGTNVIDYTAINFKSDQYDHTWYNNGQLEKDEEYNYWCGYAKTKIYGQFHNWVTGASWDDTATASIKATGGPG